MIPSSRLLWFLLGWTCLAGILEWNQILVQPLLWASAGCLLLVVQDFLFAFRVPSLSVRRTLPGGWVQGHAAECAVKVVHEGGRSAHLEVIDHPPATWERIAQAPSRRLQHGQELVAKAVLRPGDRGDFRFRGTGILVDSPLRLWRRKLLAGKPEPVRVFPELSILRTGPLLDANSRIPRAGVHRKRRRGEGTEFHQLREYRQGDPLRSIDWKATARQGRPVSREYQEERDQQVLILLDAGRRMIRRDGAKSHFDHCLEAALRLSWAAIREGDAVGLMCFSDRVHRYVAPSKGRAGLDRIIEGTYDLQPDEAPPDYLVAAEELRSRVRRRALVVLVTLLEEEDSSTLHTALSLVRSRHLVLCASLRETALDQALGTQPADFPTARTQASLLVLLEQRREAVRRLGLPSRLLVESSPATLHEQLVNRYLAIKGSGKL